MPFSLSETYFPPPTHTKGKWSSTFPTVSKETSPPSSYTKGKWKPPTPLEEKSRVSQTFSKGKWNPSQGKLLKNTATVIEESPFRKSSGTVQYWCGSCNRRLASKVVYERHLKSELHFKRTLHDRDFEESSVSEVALQTIKERKRARKTKAPLSLEISSTAKKRTRQKLFIKCEVCRSRVNRNLIGKHLISHYHCRKGDISCAQAQAMVLDNIYEIVLQSPFQCAACKFYCNTEKEFLNHWSSPSHLTSIGSGGFFWCTFCNVKAIENDDMLTHLNSKEHKEVVSVINRSVPIAIKKINPIECPTCGQQFLLNVQLRQHCRDVDHSYPSSRNPLYTCRTCDKYFKSSVSLTKHQRQKHKRSVFSCSVCDLKFQNAAEAKRHRKSSEHRYAILSRNNAKLGLKPAKRKCAHCGEEFDDFLELKKHLKDKHEEFGPRYVCLCILTHRLCLRTNKYLLKFSCYLTFGRKRD